MAQRRLITMAEMLRVWGVLALWALVAACGGGSARSTVVAPPLPVPRAEGPALTLDDAALKSLAPERGFLLGVESAALAEFAELRGRRVVLVTNSTAIDTAGTHTAEHLARAYNVALDRVLVVADGITTATAGLEAALRVREGLPVEYLTPDAFRPTRDMLASANTIVFDVALEGPRTALDAAVLGAALEEASIQGKRLVVFDRPSLADPAIVQGPVAVSAEPGSRDAFRPIPLLPGLTAGELALLYNKIYGIQADLHVAPMANWKRTAPRAQWPPSPDAANLTDDGKAHIAEVLALPVVADHGAALAAAGRLALGPAWSHMAMARNEAGAVRLLLEPSELDPFTVAERLTTLAPEGVKVQPVDGEVHGKARRLLAVDATGAAPISPLALSLAFRLAGEPRPDSMELPARGGAYGDASVVEALKSGLKPRQIHDLIAGTPQIAAFLATRKGILLYE